MQPGNLHVVLCIEAVLYISKVRVYSLVVLLSQF